MTKRATWNQLLRLLVVAAMLLPMISIVSPQTGEAAGPYSLLMSLSSNRLSPIALEGQTVAGNIYIFTSPDTSDIARVRFWLNDPNMVGKPYRTENSAPYDFAGGSVSTANPFNTTRVADGSHIITAAIELTNGTTEFVSAGFTVSNSGPALIFSPNLLSFSLTESEIDSKTTTIDTSDGTSTSFVVGDDASWLTTSSTSTSTPATLTVTVNTTGLAAGTYSATVTASASGYTPATLSVTLAVNPPYDQVHLAWVDHPSTTMTVVWRTWDTATPSSVEYRPLGTTTWNTATGTLRSSGTTGTLHEVPITDLTPSTAYEYRVQGDGGSWSQIFSTRTAPLPGPADFDAIYVADTGLGGREDGLATGTQQVVDEIAALNPLVVLPGGDYAYFDTDKRFGTLDNTIDAWFNQMQPIASRSPLMPTYGNHEVLLGEGFQPWADRFPTPDGLNGRQNYSFDIGDVHFISILAVSNSGGLTSNQLAWIEQDITAAQAAGQRWIIPYFHVSPFSDGTNHPSNLNLRSQLGPLFEQLGVKLVIASHDQSYERTYPLTDVPTTNTPTSTSQTCYTMSDGVTWVKVSPGGKLSNINGSFSSWATDPPPHWTAFRDNTMHHFLRIRVSALGTLRVEAFGVSGDGSAPVIQDSFEYTTGSCSPEEPGDNAPSVSIAAPSAGSTVSGNVTIQVQASDVEDDAGMLAVAVQIDSDTWQTAAYNATSGYYELPWDTALYSEGSHTLTARATDSAGQTTTASSITVTIDNLADPPSTYGLFSSLFADRSNPVSLGGLTVAGNIYVFTSPDTSDIRRVRFWLDDPNMTGVPDQTENNDPYDFAGGTVSTANPFDTTTLTDGSHTITAAIEMTDGTTEVVSATFTVDNSGGTAPDDTTAPAVPMNLTATVSTDGSTITLDWDDNTETDLAGYHVYRSDASGGTYTRLTSALVASSTYSDTTAPAGSTSYYYVTAVDTNGNESNPSNTADATRPASNYSLLVSTSSDRSNPVMLNGLTVAGTIYVFTSPDASDIRRVRFWLDDPNMVGKPYRTENNAPYDFAGGTVSSANPFNTSTIANGSHTITAVIEFSNGTIEVISATFTVSNG